MINQKCTHRAKSDISTILFELGIIDSQDKIIDPNKDIRKELGLDSQEVMTLVEIVSSLAISAKPLHEDNVNTLNDLIDYLSVHRDSWLYKDVPFILQSSTIINRDIDSVFGYIKDYQRWPEILAHVSKIETENDDGQMQSFIMHIEELGTGEKYFVKSWRYVNEALRIIDFSQTLPPKEFRFHKGGWRFQSLEEGRTRLISYHGFSLSDDANAEDAVVLIRKHLHAALSTWACYGNAQNHV